MRGSNANERDARRTAITVAAGVTMQTTGSDLLQARSERREGGQRGGKHPREVGANYARIPARQRSERDGLAPYQFVRGGHGPTLASARDGRPVSFAQAFTAQFAL